MSVQDANVVIVVFAMPGCGHCEEYLPRLEAQIQAFQQYGHPFVLVEAEDQILQRGQIPVVVVDASSKDAGLQAYADRFAVKGMPTTVFLTRRRGFHTLEGAIDDPQIHQLLAQASQVNAAGG